MRCAVARRNAAVVQVNVTVPDSPPVHRFQKKECPWLMVVAAGAISNQVPSGGLTASVFSLYRVKTTTSLAANDAGNVMIAVLTVALPKVVVDSSTGTGITHPRLKK